jgi:hypothetical protein
VEKPIFARARSNSPVPVMNVVKTPTESPPIDTATAELARILIPPDIRTWVDGAALANLVRTALVAMAPTEPVRGDRQALAGEPSPQALMAVLAYSYAAGNLMSETIAGETQADNSLQALCGGQPVGEADLRRFRRACRSQVQRCLTKVLELAWNKHLDLAARVLFGAGHSLSLEKRTARSPCEPVCEPVTPAMVFALEAERRLAYAVQLDSMALDF